MRLSDYEDEEAAPEKWNCIRNNDPSVTHLILQPAPNRVPSFYQNLAEALKYNTNIAHLKIDNEYYHYHDSIPNGVFDPIFESSNYIETLEIAEHEYGDNCVLYDDIFRSFVKSKNNKITKLKINLTEECMELLTTFLSANMDNQILKLILQRKIGTEAASKISDELFPTNSIKELYLCEGDEYISTATFRPLLEAIGTLRSLESLRIDLYQFDHKDINLIASLEKILFNNNKLKKLSIVNAEIELQDLEKIASAIQKLPSLESLVFHGSIHNPPNNVIIEDVIKKRFPMISNKYNLTCKVHCNICCIHHTQGWMHC